MNAIVSACLLGINCRYDGGNSRNQKLFEFMEEKGITPIPVCPEQLAGLPTPRVECEIDGDGFDVLSGKNVYSKDGKIMTDFFIRGAEEVLKIARITGCQIALMKAKSPSCGAGSIYDGTFTRKTREGYGVTSALLRKNGIDVIEFD